MAEDKNIKEQEKSCKTCKYVQILASGTLICDYEDSYYFGSYVKERDHCPDWRENGRD